MAVTIVSMMMMMMVVMRDDCGIDDDDDDGDIGDVSDAGRHGARNCGNRPRRPIVFYCSTRIDQYRERSPPSLVLSYSVADQTSPSGDPSILLKCLMFQVH